jgi:hypothetical protein
MNLCGLLVVATLATEADSWPEILPGWLIDVSNDGQLEEYLEFREDELLRDALVAKDNKYMMLHLAIVLGHLESYVDAISRGAKLWHIAPEVLRNGKRFLERADPETIGRLSSQLDDQLSSIYSSESSQSGSFISDWSSL